MDIETQIAVLEGPEALPRPAGPNRYTPAVVGAIDTALRLGNTRRAASEAVGVHRSTFYAWLADPTKLTFGYRTVQGRDGDGNVQTREVPAEVVTFKEMVTQAEAFGQHRCIAIIAQCAQGGALKTVRTRTSRSGEVFVEREFYGPNSAAAQWLLERKYPHEWGQKKSGDDLSHLTDDEIVALLAEDPAVGAATDDSAKQLTAPA